MTALFRRLGAPFLLEGLVLLVVTPFLLFPARFPNATILALLILAGSWLFAWWRTGRPLPATPFNSALLLWSLALLVGILVTADPDLTLDKAAGLILGLAAWRFLATAVTDRRQLAWSVAAFLLLGLAFTAVGVMGAFWRFKVPLLETLLQQLPPRLLSLPGAPEEGVQMNQLGGTILIYLPLLVAAVAGWRPQRYRRLLLPALAAATVLTGGLLLLTQSRSAWIGGAAGLLFLLALWSYLLPASRKRSLILLAVIVLVLGAALGLWLAGPGRLQRLWAEPPVETAVGALTTINFRKEVWQWALVGVADFPFTGMGLGSFRRVVRRLYPIAIVPSYDIAHAHNIFLQVALDTGLPGLIAYLAILIIAGGVGWQIIKRERSFRPLAIGLLGGLVALHVYGLSDALAPGSKSALIFWIALGLLTAMGRMEKKEKSGQSC